MGRRILYTVILLLSVLFVPLYVSVALGLAGFFYFRAFVEGLVVFFIADLMYGADVARFHQLYFVTFLSALLIFALVEYVLKKKLKFYS